MDPYRNLVMFDALDEDLGWDPSDGLGWEWQAINGGIYEDWTDAELDYRTLLGLGGADRDIVGAAPAPKTHPWLDVAFGFVAGAMVGALL